MFHEVLLPTDGSAGAEHAVAQAIDIATKYNARLHVLYVVDTPSLTPDMDVELMTEELEWLGQEVTEEIIDRASQAGVGNRTGVCHEGTPYQVIVEYADEQDIDLIVMGTHGRTGLKKYLLGSVTQRVLRLLTVPVLVSRVTETNSVYA